ncbi:protease inhibitor I42 family protein [Deinococcus ruber]|nr:protease inhibitor I42 family protein [Deinococcus ruber]
MPPMFGAASAQTIGTARTLDITVQSAGQTLTVRAGDILRFSVSNSAGTGYTWHALDVDPEYLVLIDKTTAAPPTPKPGQAPVVGGPGPTVVYVYYVRKSLNLGSYSVTSPIIFANVPPGRSTGQDTRLVQFNLTSR